MQSISKLLFDSRHKMRAHTHTLQLTEPTTTPRTRPHRRSSLTRTQSGPIPLAFESAGLDAEHRTSIKFRPHSALQYFVEFQNEPITISNNSKRDGQNLNET